MTLRRLCSFGKFINYFLIKFFSAVSVFAVELEKADIDEELKVPRFLIECSALIELSIDVNGIYRASGNKNSIEEVKKRVSILTCLIGYI